MRRPKEEEITSKDLPNLPDTWAWARVGEVGRVQLGRQRAPQHHSGEHMRPYLRAANVFEDRIDVSDVLQMNFTPEEYKTYTLKPGDILLNEGQSRELVGRPAMFRNELPGACFQNTLVRFQATSAVLPEYALLTFRHYMKNGRFQQIAQWTTNIAHLGAARFAALEFPVAPVAEQHRIVTKANALSAKSRRAKEALDAIPALLERFRKSVLAAAFRGDLTADWREKNPDVEPAEELLKRIRAERRRRWEEAELAKMRAKGKVPGDDRWKERYEEPAPVDASELPELPEGWCWASFKELIISIRGGVTSRAQHNETPHPVLKSSAVRQGLVDYSDISYVSTGAEDAFYLHEGDLLFTRLSGTLAYVGNCAVVRGLNSRKMQYPDRIFRVELAEILNKDYVAWSFGCATLRRRLEDVAKSTAGHQRISISDLEDFMVPLPSIAEQQAISTSIRTATDTIASIAQKIDTLVTALGDLDRSILAKAFRGELVPQDPNDEPAPVLLERLRVESARNGTTSNSADRRREAATPELREAIPKAAKLAPGPQNRASRSARR